MQFITVLFIYSLAVYGIAWVLTKSRLFSFYRDTVASLYKQRRDINFKQKTTKNTAVMNIAEEWNYLSHCIVCTSAWVGALISITANKNSILHEHIIVANGLDLLTWVSYSCAITWLIAVAAGDAD